MYPFNPDLIWIWMDSEIPIKQWISMDRVYMDDKVSFIYDGGHVQDGFDMVIQGWKHQFRPDIYKANVRIVIFFFYRTIK